MFTVNKNLFNLITITLLKFYLHYFFMRILKTEPNIIKFDGYKSTYSSSSKPDADNSLISNFKIKIMSKLLNK